MHAVTRRHTLAAAIALSLALAGAACSRHADNAGGASAAAAKEQAMAAADSAAATEAAPSAPAGFASQDKVARADNVAGGDEMKGLANHNGSQLAYAHDVQLRLPGERIAGNLGSVRDACNAQAFGPCDVLSEQLSTAGAYPGGELRMRAAPEAISGLVKAAAAGGSIAERNTQAEDLAEAVRDNGMRRKRLELQHEKLSEILARGHGNLDELVALTERLSSLEAELAQADQEAAQQQRRIATNLLTLHFTAENVSVASETSTRVGEAFRSLTGTWDEILAWMVRAFLGALLPFALLFGALGWLAWKLLRVRRPAPVSPSAAS